MPYSLRIILYYSIFICTYIHTSGYCFLLLSPLIIRSLRHKVTLWVGFITNFICMLSICLSIIICTVCTYVLWKFPPFLIRNNRVLGGEHLNLLSSCIRESFFEMLSIPFKAVMTTHALIFFFRELEWNQLCVLDVCHIRPKILYEPMRGTFSVNFQTYWIIFWTTWT